MIDSIYFKSLRKSESVQFFNDVLQLCNDSNPETLNITVQVDSLSEHVAQLNKSLGDERGSDLTVQLNDLDVRRDRAFTCLRMMSVANRYHFEQTKKEAAQAILGIIEKYGSEIARMNYQAETSNLTNLTHELLADSKLVEYTQLLNIDDVVNELNIANDAFNNLFLERIKEEAGKNEVAAGVMLRETIEIYRSLTAHIEANATLYPSAFLSDLINQLNQLIEKYMNIIIHRTNKEEESVI